MAALGAEAELYWMMLGFFALASMMILPVTIVSYFHHKRSKKIRTSCTTTKAVIIDIKKLKHCWRTTKYVDRYNYYCTCEFTIRDLSENEWVITYKNVIVKLGIEEPDILDTFYVDYFDQIDVPTGINTQNRHELMTYFDNNLIFKVHYDKTDCSFDDSKKYGIISFILSFTMFIPFHIGWIYGLAVTAICMVVLVVFLLALKVWEKPKIDGVKIYDS